jgi:hypothetical protein
MAVSINGDNEEAVARPVHKIKLVDMLENHSKTGERFDNKQLGKKTYHGESEQACSAFL